MLIKVHHLKTTDLFIILCVPGIMASIALVSCSKLKTKLFIYLLKNNLSYQHKSENACQHEWECMPLCVLHSPASACPFNLWVFDCFVKAKNSKNIGGSILLLMKVRIAGTHGKVKSNERKGSLWRHLRKQRGLEFCKIPEKVDVCCDCVAIVVIVVVDVVVAVVVVTTVVVVNFSFAAFWIKVAFAFVVDRCKQFNVKLLSPFEQKWIKFLNTFDI